MKKENVTLKVEGFEIRGEVYSPPSVETPNPALCICHGIPAQVPDPADRGYPLLAERFCAEGFVTMIFNFRGAGASQGNFDILGWTRDLEAAIDYVSCYKRVDASHISVLGFSGGAAVAIYVASQNNKITSLVACACPANFAMLAKPEEAEAFIERARGIGIIRDKNFPPSLEEWIQGFRQVKPIDWIDKFSPCPILLIHGDADETVPVSHAHKLYRRASAPKDIFILQKGKHRLRLDQRAMDVALAWLKKANKLE